MLIDWQVVPADGCTSHHRVLSKLISGIPHMRADVFKYNVELFRNLVTLWSKSLQVDGHQIAGLMETKGGQYREVEAGIHVSACLLINDILPYEVGDQGQTSRVCKAIILCISDKRATVYNAAAEVLGLLMKKLLPEGNDEQVR